MTAPSDDTTTDLHAVIAALRAERDAALAREVTLTKELGVRDAEKAARTAGLADSKTEFDERIEHQVATVDVLRVMSASPSDTLPVFKLITRRAAELCESSAALYELRDGQLNYMAGHGMSPETLVAFRQTFPRPLDRSLVAGRAILARRIIHVQNVAADAALSQLVRDLGGTAIVAIPLLRGSEPIGAIALNGRQPAGFSESQIALLQTFAEQAVIAINSAETYRALQTRTSELQETLEYQTATSDVLAAISRSTGEVEPVLATLVETAARICEAEKAIIFRLQEGRYHLSASVGFSTEFKEHHAQHPTLPGRGTVTGRVAAERRVVHIDDAATDPEYTATQSQLLGGTRSMLGAPLLRGDEVLGVITVARSRVKPFTEKQIELVRTFADQAVIAMENARLLGELRGRTTDLEESLEYQTATSDVLKVISRSTFDLQPVLETVLLKASRLCDAEFGVISTREGGAFRVGSVFSTSPEYQAIVGGRLLAAERGTVTGRTAVEGRIVHILDIREDPDYTLPEVLQSGGARSCLGVPLLREGAVVGVIGLARHRVEAFTEQQIELVSTFADQAVIAIENTRLITEQREALEQQTATAEVLQVINTSPGNLTPVFDTILEKAHSLCGAPLGSLVLRDGDQLRAVATRGYPQEYEKLARQGFPPTRAFRLFLSGERFVHVLDSSGPPTAFEGDPLRRELAEIAGVRTALFVPLRKDETVLGYISAQRQEVRPFTDKQIALLQNFAAQAVIAMENARLLDEIRQRQEELRVTFENMGDGVALFDETRHLVASNQRFQHMLDVPDDVIASRPSFSDYIRYLADQGEYGPEPEDHVQQLLALGSQRRTFERTRPNGRIMEIRVNPVPGGGFVVIYSDITERKRSEEEIRAARDAAEEASRTIEAAYRDLKAAQANLIQAEKMASLGQLTAGIAHEIKNPLNFVNNFAALSVDLLGELKDAIAPAEPVLSGKQRAEVEDVSAMLTSNLEKINEHGKRADGIVKAMLEHSRGSSGERRMVDLNSLIDDALNLAYHGARAQDQSFNITLERDFAEGIAPIELAPQDMTRVFLNLFSNGFYAATRGARQGADAGFMPTLKVSTNDAGEAVEIRVRDNGIGISADIRDKLFQPFFTTKPTGEGTGLGLSITYDIVTQQHGGSIAVDSKVGEYSEFVIRLPRSL